MIDYKEVSFRIEFLKVVLAEVSGMVCEGARGKIASKHFTEAITSVVMAERHVNGQKRIDESREMGL